MNRRNWLALQRKLVDVTDLDYTVNAVQTYMAQNNLAFFGEGVLITTTYPNPFPVSVDSGDLNGIVGKGVGYDSAGYQVRIDDTLGNFAIIPGDSAHGRLDLLVVHYMSTGDTQIPEPSQPTTTIYLNLIDGYRVSVIQGTPSATPVYPSKGQYDIILAGLNVPQGTTVGSQVTVDLSVRDIATPLRTFFPTFKQETLAGTIDGSNTAFTLSQTPYNSASLLVSVDGTALHSSEWTLTGQTVTLATPPVPGQDVYGFYVVNSAGSTNPVAGLQEVPSGTVDGTNNTFVLSGHPVDQNSTQVFVDGVLVPITGWNLSTNPSVSKIYFNAGFIPGVGQDVYVYYLQNTVAASTSGSSSGGGGSGSSNLATEYPQLSSGDISNGYVTLMHAPLSPTAVMFDVIGGGAQAYGTDFTVSGLQLSWSGDLVAALAVGDRFRIHYAY